MQLTQQSSGQLAALCKPALTGSRECIHSMLSEFTKKIESTELDFC